METIICLDKWDAIKIKIGLSLKHKILVIYDLFMHDDVIKQLFKHSIWGYGRSSLTR